MSGTMAGVVGIGAIACGAFANACLTVGAEAILIFGGFAFTALGFILMAVLTLFGGPLVRAGWDYEPAGRRR